MLVEALWTCSGAPRPKGIGAKEGEKKGRLRQGLAGSSTEEEEEEAESPALEEGRMMMELRKGARRAPP